ncbi:MAG: putative porin [Paramuribaculum sp.]|nr:putative porin [Paramuribaculum sp.]
MKRFFILSIASALMMLANVCKAKSPEIAHSYAWKMLPPLGLHEPATIDTLLYNYYIQAVPNDVSLAWATTGNLGAQGMNMIYFERPAMSDFFFHDALAHWLPEKGNHKFYNTRIPMTLLSYNFGGGRENAQDRLTGVFSGNVNKRLQIGANLDYLYSKGSYSNQADKNLAWGLSSSYMGDRYELQMFFNHYNLLNKENGGITDDLYITDPEQLQGGSASINPKTIPTRLSAAHSRIRGKELYINQRYKVGYWHITPPNDSIPNDTIEHKEYIPVSSFIWTLNYNAGRHMFKNTSAEDASEFWENSYLSRNGSTDVTTYWSLKNTVGVSLLEGFHKYAKFGLSAYITHEIRRYNQTVDSIPIGEWRPAGLTPYPFDVKLAPKATENLMWVGGQLTKQKGSLLRYEATGRFGIIGPVAGDLLLDGNVSTRFKFLGDSVNITAYGRFSNEEVPYLIKQYVSNHFIWQNDFGKTRRLKLGGALNLGKTMTYINAGVENIQNLIYFGENCMPMQNGGSVQVVSASLSQNFKVGILHWNNRLNFQTSSNDAVLPLPKFSVYSNLYILFKVAKVLDVQFGIDCDYYSKYYAPGYQPATTTFYNQREIKCGNYPFMNAYANMKLSKARFYVMFSHVNQGLTGNNYFSMPHYPMNPRRFQLGVSVDFAN